MQFRVLGPLELFDERRPLAVGGGRQRTLLLVLLLHSNDVVSTDRLIEALWGERAPASAAQDAGLAPNKDPLPDQVDKIRNAFDYSSGDQAANGRAVQTVDTWVTNGCAS